MKDQSSRERFMDGNYQKIRRLGKGGDGTVYLVRYLPTEQLRAAKQLKENGGRRVHELKMMKRLHHPSLPQIIDVLECEGQTWLVMEYIRGRTLSEPECRATQARQFWETAEQLAQVIAYLHTQTVPVLHLDIKPTNVLLHPDGHLVLIDFGTAVFQGDTDGREACMGTPGFAAPEQYGDEAPDTRADIYAFGATMYYCLYGAVPQRQTQGTRREKKWPGDRLSWKRSAELLLAKCLQKDKQHRFADGRQLYRAVCRQHQRYKKKQSIRKASGAAVLLIMVVLFGAKVNKPDRPDRQTEMEEEYLSFLERAKGMGLTQAQTCYQEAVKRMPEDERWYVQLFDWLERDYIFSTQEEHMLQELIYLSVEDGHTALDLLKKHTEEYGAFAYRLGVDYWYFYEGAGGKAAASSWFREAAEAHRSVRAARETAMQGQSARSKMHRKDSGGWGEAAGIYADIASYYETLGKPDEQGKHNADVCVYWKDLKKLWALGEKEQTAAVIRWQIAKEMLSILTMRAAELRQAGEGWQETQRLLRSLDLFLHSEALQENEEVDWAQYEAACAAVERVFADERGNTLERKEKDTEKKETDP